MIQKKLLEIVSEIDKDDLITARFESIFKCSAPMRKSSLKILFLLTLLISKGETNRSNLRSIVLLIFSVPHAAEEKAKWMIRVNDLIDFAIDVCAVSMQHQGEQDFLID